MSHRFIEANEPPSSPFSWHIQSMSSLRCKALCIVMNFLILWPLCLRSSHAHFENGLEYLTRETTQLFILLMRCLLYRLVSSSFFRSPEILKKILLCVFLWRCPLPIIPDTCNFPFLRFGGFWMASILPLISISPGLFSKRLGTFPSTQITISITVTLLFHSLSSFKFPGNVQVFVYPFAFFYFHSVIHLDGKIH